MTDVIVSNIDVVVEVQQPTVPPTAPPPKVGLVEINQVVQRGSAWMTGHGPPSAAGGQAGDMYLDMDTGDVYLWNGAAWDFQGTFAPSTLTPEEILEALITVDGAGSNLDADLLDGQHGAYYATKTSVDAVVTKNTEQDALIAGNTTSINNNDADIADLQAATTPAALLASIKTVDGPGSGLDADTLDGHDTPYFATQAGLTAEATTRANADTALDGRITTEKNRNDAQDTAIALRITDAPSNTNAYGRKAAAWVDVTEEAPADGLGYMRKNGAWTPSSGGATTDDAPPAGPLQDGQFWWKSSTGVLYLWYDDGNSQQWVQVSASPQMVAQKTAETRNRLTNGAILVSQENGENNITAASGFFADQWLIASSGLSHNTQRASNQMSPDGNTKAGVQFFSVAKPTLAATDYCQNILYVEGLDITDLKWGTADAKQVILRFSAYTGTPGLYPISIINGAGDRSYVKAVNLANGWQTIVLVIPGDTTGTWATGSTLGLTVRIASAAGANFQGVEGWQDGAKFSLPGMVNLASVINKYLVFTDFALYADPDKTGLLPRYELPDYAETLAKCLRYWERQQVSVNNISTNLSGGQWPIRITYATIKRVNPTVAINPFNGSGSLGTGVTAPLNGQGAHYDFSAAFSVGGSNGSCSYTVTANARM